MPRPRQRICLEAGLKLDKLMRDGCVRPGLHTAWRSTWTNYCGDEIASIDLTCSMLNQHQGWLRIQIDVGHEQKVILTPRARRFGGHQWYFVCPVEDRCCSVLWMPPGATHFRCRQGWGRRVAYTSQFLDADNRAHRGKAKIKAKLIADLDPDEWELPPKPSWMRWRTYNRYVERFDRYEEVLDRGVAELMAKLLASNFLKDQ